MAWTTPTLSELVTRAVRAFSAHMPGADAALRRNNLNPVAKVVAGVHHGLHVHADYIARGRFVLTADGDLLDRHGAQMKPAVPRREAAPASGFVVATAPVTAQLFAGNTFTRSDGAVYTVSTGVVLVSGAPTNVQVVAVEPGAAGNTDAAAVMTTENGVAGIVAEVGADGLTGGADLEGHETYRHRLLFAKAFPEHAGALPDFVRYVSEVAGVTRVFVEPGINGRATVGLYPLFDDTRANGIPSAGDLTRVSDHIADRAPGGVLAYVLAATTQAIDVTISGLSPDTPEVRLAVVEELRAMVASKGRVAGVSYSHPSMPFLASPVSFPRSWFWEAISSASGETSHVVTAPAADTAITAGAVPTLGTVSFV